MNIEDFARDVHALATEKGWWDKERPIEDTFVMLHCELSEAVEEYRNGHGMTEIYYSEDGKPEGVPVELADVVIRLLDAAMEYGDYGKFAPINVEKTYESFGAFIERCHEDVVSVKCGVQLYKTIGLQNTSYSMLISRIRRWFDQNGMDLWRVCRMKHEYNKTRPYRHGNKRM